MAYIPLPAFRAPTGIDFAPLGDAFDTIGETLRRNRLLEQQKELGAALQQPSSPAMGDNPYQAPSNRLLGSQPSPAMSSAAAAGRAMPVASPGDPNLPAGMRNNNPGNIKYIPGAKYAGLVGPSQNTDQGDPQMVFDTPQNGMKAAADLAMRKYQGGKRTAMDLIAGNMGWTPGNTSAAANIARTMGVAPNEDLRLDDPTRLRAFMQALTLQEHGAASRRYGDDVYGVIGGQSQPSQAPAPTSRPSVMNYDAGIQTALRQGNIGLAQQLQAAKQEAENTAYQRGRQATQDQQAAESHSLSTQAARETLQEKFINRVAGVAQTIGRETDPAKKAAMWQRFVSTDPRIAAGIQKYGVDVNNPDAGVQAIIAEAQGLTGKKYEFTKYGVGDPSTGEIRPYAQGGDPDTRIEQAKLEQGLRKEWSTLTADVKTINDSVARVKTGAALDSGTGDLAIVYGYMKLLDPGSVVREGEFATAEQTAGLPQQVVGLYNKLIEGERLTPVQRQQFTSAAEGLASDKMKRFGATRQQFETIARQAGADPSRIMLDEGGAAAPTPPPASTRPRAVNPQTNETVEYNEQSGQWEPVR